MKRKKFYLVFGFLLVLVVAFVGWCGQSFFTSPTIHRGAGIPDEAWAAIVHRFPAGRCPAAAFNERNVETLVQRLARPHEIKPDSAEAVSSAPYLVAVYHSVLGQSRSYLLFKDDKGTCTFEDQIPSEPMCAP
jgi:hypothetical protein